MGKGNKKNNKTNQANNIHNSTFPSSNFSIFTEEDGSTVHNEGRLKNAEI